MTFKQTSGAADSDEQRQSMIKALLREKGYATVRGDQATIAEIDKELRRLGHEAAKPVERAEKRPSRSPRAKR